MVTLQDVHGALHELGCGLMDRPTSISAIAEKLNENKEIVARQLGQLSDLGYIRFSRDRTSVILTENGVRTTPPALSDMEALY